MIFNTNIFEHELRDILRMFVPFFDMPIDISFNYNDVNCSDGVKNCDGGTYDGAGGVCEIKIGEKTYKYTVTAKDLSQNLPGGGLKRELKKRLYLALRDYLGRGLPWGSLTGIRPSKIIYKYLSSGGKAANTIKMLQDEYYVSPKKAELAAAIVQNQTEFLKGLGLCQDLKQDGTLAADKGNLVSVPMAESIGGNDGLDSFVNLYIHIPFCPTRCSYCSFVSVPYEKNEELLKEYVRFLCRDIAATKALIKKQNKKILSVYIGGGTPAVLGAEELRALLSAVSIGENSANADENVGHSSGIEFTFEAGRPDSITEEKLGILKEYGVTRVCVNPQSFNEKTLAAIGRKHSAESIFSAFDLCRKFGFDINMDLIAGLPEESLNDFEYSLKTAIALKPENITVHALSLKRGSQLNERLIEGGENPLNSCFNAESMVDSAHDALKKAAYLPYYLYRQKEMAQNLENTGYCLKGKQSVNNITVMEETVSVYACGAGAINKKVCRGVITRLAELRDVGLYIKEFDDRLARKTNFLYKE